MKLLIAAVGRVRKGPERTLYEQYAGRLSPPLEVVEVEERKALSPDQLKAREGDLLLAKVPAGAVRVVLDERGRSLDSRALAERIGGWRDEGRPAAAFLIGGAHGHGDPVRKGADLLLSLGPMTWPHMLVRTLIAEQLYRADCILRGHPYHKD